MSELADMVSPIRIYKRGAAIFVKRTFILGRSLEYERDERNNVNDKQKLP